MKLLEEEYEEAPANLFCLRKLNGTSGNLLMIASEFPPRGRASFVCISQPGDLITLLLLIVILQESIVPKFHFFSDFF